MISFIVQGPVSDSTQSTVDSIRLHFPSSEIILASTNGRSDVDGVDVVELAGEEQEVNVNKQIVSSQAVNKAKFDVSCKVRNDIVFTNDNIVKFINEELLGHSPRPRLDTHQLFSRVVMASNYFFCNPVTSGFFYHPSDWLFLGLTEDIQKLFNIPLQDPEKNNFFLEEEVTLPFGDTISGERLKYRPEQDIFIAALNANGFDVSLNYEYQIPDDIDECYKLVLNNFYISDVGDSSGFYSSKYPTNKGSHPNLFNKHEYNLLHDAMIKEFK